VRSCGGAAGILKKMSSKRLTFVDSSVLINAIVGLDAARKMRALAVLGDPNREFVATRIFELGSNAHPHKIPQGESACFLRTIL
jgi:hypothetical protein